MENHRSKRRLVNLVGMGLWLLPLFSVYICLYGAEFRYLLNYPDMRWQIIHSIAVYLPLLIAFCLSGIVIRKAEKSFVWYCAVVGLVVSTITILALMIAAIYGIPRTINLAL